MKRRTKIATILTTGLLSAALVGVGFAAWTIGTSDDGKEENIKGTVSVETVTPESGIQSLTATIKDNTLHLGGKPTNYSEVTCPWVKFTDEGDDDLVLTIEVEVVGTLKSLTISSDWDGTVLSDAVLNDYTVSATGIGALADKTFEAAGKVLTIQNETQGVELNGAVDKITITITFTYKDGHPYDGVVNQATYDKTKSTAFQTAMSELSSFQSEHGEINFTVQGA